MGFDSTLDIAPAFIPISPASRPLGSAQFDPLQVLRIEGGTSGIASYARCSKNRFIIFIPDCWMRLNVRLRLVSCPQIMLRSRVEGARYKSRGEALRGLPPTASCIGPTEKPRLLAGTDIPQPDRSILPLSHSLASLEEHVAIAEVQGGATARG
jgi:hypothetical protein